MRINALAILLLFAQAQLISAAGLRWSWDYLSGVAEGSRSHSSVEMFEYMELKVLEMEKLASNLDYSTDKSVLEEAEADIDSELSALQKMQEESSDGTASTAAENSIKLSTLAVALQVRLLTLQSKINALLKAS